MPTFELKIEDSEQIRLFQMLASQLGIEMSEIPQENGQADTSESSETKRYYEEKDHYDYEDILAIVAQFPPDKKWTFSDLQNENIFPESNVKVEIIDNQIYIMKNPSTLHQRILTRTSRYIDTFVDENELGYVYVAPTSVKIDENNNLEPDIIYISVAKSEHVTMRAIEAPPELVVEVISPANYKKLREAKKAKYADFGVEEYWEIYPKKQLVRIETLQKNEDTEEQEYQVYSEAQTSGEVHSKVLAGFSLNIEKIFG